MVVDRLRDVSLTKQAESWRRTDGGQDLSLGAALADEAADTIEGLSSLCLEMGRLIRSMDESGEHLEFWTQDGDYIIDSRFPK